MKLLLKIPGLRPEWHISMIIQLWHLRDSDFSTELYNPVKNSSFFPEHQWIFPHDWVEIHSQESLKTVDLFIAEVSCPATGLGIELWFASAYGKKILCLYKKWSKISSSLRYITENFIEYEGSDDMVEQIHQFITIK